MANHKACSSCSPASPEHGEPDPSNVKINEDNWEAGEWGGANVVPSHWQADGNGGGGGDENCSEASDKSDDGKGASRASSAGLDM